MRANRLTDGFGTRPVPVRMDKTFETLIDRIVETDGYASRAEALYDITYKHYRTCDPSFPITTIEDVRKQGRDAIARRLEELKLKAS